VSSLPYALVVEPNTRRGGIYVHACREEGLDPAIAVSNTEAQAMLRARGLPEMVIVELTMASVNGYQLLAGLRQQHPERRVPAVVVSAFGALRDSAWTMREALSIEVVLDTQVPEAGVRLALRRALGRAAAPLPEPDNRPDPHRERVRLARLRETGLIDATTASEALDRLVQTVASAFDVEAALCSILTHDREVVLAHTGLTGSLARERGTARASSIGRHVIEAIGREALVIDDARQHPTFASNPLVREGTVRGFAGVPLAAAEGTTLGALCLLDSKALALSLDGIDELHHLARRVSGELEVFVARRPRLPGDADQAYALHHVHAVLQHLDQPVALWGPDGRVRLVNAALCAMLSTSQERLLGLDRGSFAGVLARLCADSALAHVMSRLGSEPAVAHEETVLLGPPERAMRWSTKPIPLPDGDGQLDAWRDVSAERELERVAITDPLTGLANRRGGEDAMRREVARCKRNGQPMTLLLLDIDHFKAVNDKHGHAIGDRVLRAMARIVSRQLRASDLAVRWGGEEFLAILPGTDLATGRQVAERIRKAVVDTVIDPVGVVSVSIGSAQLDKGFDALAALAMADARLYEAKSNGRNTVR